MPGSMGETDIFTATINADGSYGSPMNMGSQVNTYGKEMFPYVSKKGNLYFSSDSRGGQGGLDVYVVPLNNRTVAPVNLGSPINSPQDDFAFIIDNDKKSGYFSSNRTGGKGDDDIYYFDELKSPDLKCSQVIAGTVRDKSNGALLPGSLVTLYKGSEKLETVIVGSDAAFSFPKMDCASTYRVTGEREYYKGAEETVTTTEEADLELGLDLNLDPDKDAIAKTEGLDRCQYALDNINTIYFDLDKYYIRPDAAIELEKIVKVMNRCQDIKIEARSHTDSRASDAYNVTLSQNRAQSTVDYIISRGILADRLTAKGFGETQLVNRCSNGVKCSEAEHQVNRRTEFVIIR
jgi:outer membrane protein OmpA-like peptidoglycan-associated protein